MNSDLNTNLIKSLTSVHLPPPPSRHKDFQLGQRENQRDIVNEVLQLPPTSADSAYNNETTISATSSYQSAPQPPLNTPPHTVNRVPEPLMIQQQQQLQQQETPLNPRKRAKMLSPQYSSPQKDTCPSSPPPAMSASKPPQPTFVLTKQQKRAQRLLKKQQQAAEKQIETQLKKAEEESVPLTLPSPKDMPKIIHNSDSKPPYSYATLIGMAILRGKNRKLTLSQIYQWISQTFKYYRKNDVGWQNSIRHNLSLNKAFIKTEKSTDGKGHYWEVQKGCEMQFLKGKIGKRLSAGKDDLKSDDSIRSDPIENTTDAKSEANDEGDKGTDISRTPKAQIRSSDYKPPLRQTHTVIGLQNFRGFNEGSDTEEDTDSSDEDVLSSPRKKRQIEPISSYSFNVGSLSNAPALQAPYTNWLASATGERIVFGQGKPQASATLQPQVSKPQQMVPIKVTSSPAKAARVSSLSSFSCNTNYETSPLKRQETGPLLEPLTPSSRLNSTNSSMHHHLAPQTQAHVPLTKTPLRNTTNTASSSVLNTQQNSYVLNFLRTPNTKHQTPNGNSILRKFWNSPSFIDDFYTSPSITRYSDDDHYKGLFGSPDKSLAESIRRSTNMTNIGNLNADLSALNSSDKKETGSHGFNDLFGVDIVSVVQRAIENEAGGREDRDGDSTEDDQ